ncbi:hypothetical protein EH223_17730 [candidate division KSB1 bacterium]|nr:MAG: hypothetical protein EH223_17730 [candidate division KSB1 bacterium]
MLDFLVTVRERVRVVASEDRDEELFTASFRSALRVAVERVDTWPLSGVRGTRLADLAVLVERVGELCVLVRVTAVRPEEEGRVAVIVSRLVTVRPSVERDRLIV